MRFLIHLSMGLPFVRRSTVSGLPFSPIVNCPLIAAAEPEAPSPEPSRPPPPDCLPATPATPSAPVGVVEELPSRPTEKAIAAVATQPRPTMSGVREEEVFIQQEGW
jgi:hypothetical protein